MSTQYLLTPGQRWMSEAEPELGMGILVFHDKRTLKIDFPGGDCTRQYSLKAAPVRRVKFKTGDRVSTLDGREIVIETADETQGIMIYAGEDVKVSESDLAPFMEISLPQERMLAGLSGSSKLFDLRREIRFKQAAYDTSPAKGFLGGQVDLIPHQFYIADQVSRRYFPRVLLSDETGLGKTIEAGLILHRLLVLSQIRRVLIIVPDTLVHQWFIEFYRKFNFKFRLFDEAYCLESELGDPDMNPFSGDQQGICSQSFIQNSARRQDQILSAGWDMVVMDEAHHMTDKPEFHTFMQHLGRQTRGLMLLTATPEQMGIKTHFAQLQLLDPDRYYDLDAYVLEAKTYEATAKTVRQRLDGGKSVDRLLDSFGPGRVIFRNRRATIKGFPNRKVCLVPLTGTPEQIRQINLESRREIRRKTINEVDSSRKNQIPDLTDDPRVIYLAGLAKKIKPEKILVICSSKEIAEAIDKGIQTRISIDVTRFDETMTLLQRDRNAAWFARDKGARLLVCSEIGSEGRNFQFVHHLFLFDLPMNPELLEQRIGRVDRIGQKSDISIHVPYVCSSIQEILAQWYAKGLGLLAANINGLHSIFTQFEPRLTQLIQKVKEDGHIDQDELSALTTQAADHTQTTQNLLDRGKHILVELNSFKSEPAYDLIGAVQSLDQDSGLAQLMETLLDHYGVDMEPIVEKPGEEIISLTVDRIADEQFPALPRGGEIATFDRATAIAREEVNFMTWDHPYVNQMLDFFLTRGEGMAATALLKDADAPGLFLETLFVLEIPEIEQIPNAGLFIPTRPIHIRVDHSGTPVPDENLPEDFHNRLEPDHPSWFMDMEPVKNQLLPDLLKKSQELAESSALGMKSCAIETLSWTLGKEIERLCELKKVNPDITDQEIEAARIEEVTLTDKLSRARIRLDAVRLIRAEA